VIAGKRYGAGSARDWAAKVTRLLGVSAVLAEGFERIHRTNLVAMGVLPLVIDGAVRRSLAGDEIFDLTGLPDGLRPGGGITLTIRGDSGERRIPLTCLIETEAEARWLRQGGILAEMLNKGNE
jgi:aconitate hydratase